MEHEFSRTELLIGKEGIFRLSHATVLVFGVGGVGSHCTEALARSGIGTLVLVDSDKVSLTNINRQSIAFHSTLGREKVRVMEEKLRDINPSIRLVTRTQFLLPENTKAFFEEIQRELGEMGACSIDYVVDAIDTVSAKLSIAEYCQEHRIPLISCMGTGNKLHPELFELEDISRTSVCPLCRVMRRELRSRGITHLKVLYSKEKPAAHQERNETEGTEALRPVPGSMSYAPPVAGLLIAGEVIRSIALEHGTGEREVRNDGSV